MKPSASLLVSLFSLACISASKAAIVASYNFTTDLTSGDSEATSTASPIQGGAGLEAAVGADVGWGRSSNASFLDLFVRSTVTGTTLAADDYVGFTVTMNPGVAYNLTTLTFKYSVQLTSQGVGPFTAYAVVRSSLDNFATNLATFNHTRENTNGINILSPAPSVNLSSHTNVSGSVEFRIYIYDDADSPLSLARIDNLILNADIVPEPSGVSLVAFGSLVVGLRRKRR